MLFNLNLLLLKRSLFCKSNSPSLMQYSAISSRNSLALLELAFMGHLSIEFISVEVDLVS